MAGFEVTPYGRFSGDHRGVEVSGNAGQIRDIARRAWSGYRSECLLCFLDSGHMLVTPTLVNLYP